jgi:hypothetical protein
MILPNEFVYGVPPAAAGDPVPFQIVQAIQQQLNSSGINACEVILEHNVNTFEFPAGSNNLITPYQVFRTSLSDCVCQVPTAPLPPHAVRVTVCVPLIEVMPNCLAALGFDISEKIAQHTTTFRFEL